MEPRPRAPRQRGQAEPSGRAEEARVRRARSASRPARRRGLRQPLSLGLPGPQEPLARPPRRAGVRRPTTGPLAGPHARAATCNLRGRPHPHPDYRLPAHEADFCCLPRAREPPRPEHPGTSFLSRWTESRCSLNSDTGAVSSLCVPLVKTPSMPRPVLRLPRRCLAGRSASHTPRPTGRNRPVPVRTAQPPAKSPPLFQQPFSGPQIPLRTELQIQLIPATAKQRRGSRAGRSRRGRCRAVQVGGDGPLALAPTPLLRAPGTRVRPPRPVGVSGGSQVGHLLTAWRGRGAGGARLTEQQPSKVTSVVVITGSIGDSLVPFDAASEATGHRSCRR